MPFKCCDFRRISRQKAQVHQVSNGGQAADQDIARPTDTEVMQPSGLEYKPLKDKEVRLLRFRRETTLSGPFELQLQYWEIHRAPFYIALSYVWGNADETKPIQIDSREFNVTHNLYNALLHIHELSDTFEGPLSRFELRRRGALPLD